MNTVSRSTLTAGFETPDSTPLLYQPCMPQPVTRPQLHLYNHGLAEELGLPFTGDEPELAACLGGTLLFADATPMVAAYAGHQFGNFVPQLGDGRALQLGEMRGVDGRLYAVQLKGSGRTPFSRGGDGRSPLGPVLREYLVSEAMHALGLPTTRALAVVGSGETVLRQTGVHPGGIMTRVATGFARVGSFEYLAARQDATAIRQLAQALLARHFPEQAETDRPQAVLFSAVASAQAQLVAGWMQLGFVHGVMNTDNTAISGETIDYGPCAFLENYRAQQVFSSIDVQGRYRYDGQGAVMQWNLNSLGHCLHFAGAAGLSEEELEATLAAFEQEFHQQWRRGMLKKIGIGRPQSGDAELLDELLQLMETGEADFTLAFRLLADEVKEERGAFAGLFDTPEPVTEWLQRWRRRLEREGEAKELAAAMRRVNPLFIPRNHRIARAIELAEQGDFSEAEQLVQVLRRPCEEQPQFAEYARPAAVAERVQMTFCGT